ncbi:MAG: metallophosphoesterase [Eubacteriales bacterium]|nr:metallophosphoesterase [Eubacteriales bacterium]
MMTYILSAALIIFFCSIIFAARSEWERRQLKIEHYRIGPKGASGSGEGLDIKRSSGSSKGDPVRKGEPVRMLDSDRASDSVRIAYISDVHDYLSFGNMTDRLVRAVRSQSPELVVLGGDIITVRGGSDLAPETYRAAALAQILASEYTVLYAPGNHETRFREKFSREYADFRALLEKSGVIFLEDSCISIGDVRIYAAEPSLEYYRKQLPFLGEKTKMPEKYLIGKLGIPDRRYFNVLLMHTPLHLKEASLWGADLVISGHFHGGTVRLPGGRGLMSPQYQFFCSECSGIHRYDGTDMVVSRGLGTHTFHIRFNDLPELGIIDIISGTYKCQNRNTDLKN